MADVKIKKKELSQDFRDEFVKSLQGKEFILYGGLLTLAKAEGIKGISIEVLQLPNDDNNQTAVVMATVTDKDNNTFSEVGDANNNNCNKKVAEHKIRMAATRAKGRALRDMLGIDMVMDSELTDPYEKEMITQSQTKTIKNLMKTKGIDKDEMTRMAYDEFGVKTAARLEKDQASTLISMLEMWEPDEEELEEGDYEEEGDIEEDEE